MNADAVIGTKEFAIADGNWNGPNAVCECIGRFGTAPVAANTLASFNQ